MQRERRQERGVVMFITILLLAMMGGLGLAALESASRDRDTAGYYNRETAAFYAADAGISHARALVKKASSPDDTIVFPTSGAPQKIGDTSLYAKSLVGGGTLPSYYGDPAVATPIVRDGNGAYTEGMGLQSKGAKAVPAYWKINVVGRGTDGATVRLEAKEAKFFYLNSGSY